MVLVQIVSQKVWFEQLKKNDVMVDSSTITSTHAPSYKDRQKFEIQILIPCQIFDQRCGWLKCKNENNYERFSDSW